MSQLGKTFLWIALVGALAAVGVGVALVLQYKDTRQVLADTQTAKRLDEQTIVKNNAQITSLNADKADLTSKLTDASAKITDLNTQLATAQQQAKDSKDALQAANDATAAAQAKLDAIGKTLNGMTAEEVMTAKAKDESDLQATQAELKIMQDNLQTSTDEVAQLQDALRRSKTGTQPPGISGKVTFVDHVWNFVILDVGISAGVVPNGELIVYRGNNFLGKLRVTKVDPNDAVAEIMPDVKGDIQIGDKVLN